MKTIQILCSDPAAKAAITKKIQARGYSVDGEIIEVHHETQSRSETCLSCTPRADAKLRDLDMSLIGTPDYMGLGYAVHRLQPAAWLMTHSSRMDCKSTE